MKYDVIAVLGRGIYKDGSFSESAMSTVEKAVELYKDGEAPRIIFSGKHTYGLDYTPPTTEAEAMADYAKKLGLPDGAALVEKESLTTIMNWYFIKKKFLLPNNWKKVLLVSVVPMDERAKLTMDTILGEDYKTGLINCDFRFIGELAKEKKESESSKIVEAKELLKKSGVKAGDHEALLELEKSRLKKLGVQL